MLNLTPEEKKERRKQKQKEYKKKARAALTLERLERRRARDREYKRKNYKYTPVVVRKNRSQMTEEEWKAHKKEYDKRYRQEKKEQRAKQQKEYREKNREGRRVRDKRRRQNPLVRLSSLLSNSIRKHLASKNLKKENRKWEAIVGYTLKELMAHLESKFDENMTWENRGTYWHIDHIKPQSLFTFSSMEDPEFKACWALSNLQPLERIANITKGNRYELDNKPEAGYDSVTLTDPTGQKVD